VNFKLKKTAAVSHGFLATTRLSDDIFKEEYLLAFGEYPDSSVDPESFSRILYQQQIKVTFCSVSQQGNERWNFMKLIGNVDCWQYDRPVILGRFVIALSRQRYVPY